MNSKSYNVKYVVQFVILATELYYYDREIQKVKNTLCEV